MSFVAIMLGSATTRGIFEAPHSLATGTPQSFLTVGDFNGDGIDDLAAASSLYSTVYRQSGATTVKETSQKYLEARASLPEELHAVFDRLVDEYVFHCQVAYGRRHVSHHVLAALVKDGWRPSDSPTR